MKKLSFGLIWKSLKDSFSEFGKDKITKLSASLAYYTAFSLAPLLVVVIAICGLVFGQQAIEGTLEEQIRQIVGPDAAAQIQTMIKNASLSGGSTLATVIGSVTLLISATTIFSEMQDSINSIWGPEAKTLGRDKTNPENPLVVVWCSGQPGLYFTGVAGGYHIGRKPGRPPAYYTARCYGGRYLYHQSCTDAGRDGLFIRSDL